MSKTEDLQLYETGPLQGIDAATLARAVPGSLVPVEAGVSTWKIVPLLQGGGEAPGVYRLSSTRGGSDGDPWTIILKVLPPASSTDTHAWNFPQREYYAYGSGLLQAAQGVAMPQCHGRTRRPDGTAWLWLEDVADDEVWPLSRYRLAAYHLGRFNGHYMDAGAIPVKPWLSHRWLRGWLEEAGPAVNRLRELRDSPEIAAVYPNVDAILSLWSQRTQKLDRLENFPQTICHLDVHRRNMFSRRVGRQEQTVLIDWAFVGTAAVGEDLATLVSASIAFGDVPVGEIRELESAVMQGYLEGLRDTGHPTDPEQVWAAYALAASLRLPVGAVRLVLPLLLEPDRHEREQQQHDRPWVELFDRWSAMNMHLIALSHEAGA